jgi:hypothetical protein
VHVFGSSSVPLLFNFAISSEFALDSASRPAL